MRKHVTKVAAVTMLLALSACGGGGGGGATSNATNPVPVPSTLQAPGTTVTYGVNSAVGIVQNR